MIDINKSYYIVFIYLEILIYIPFLGADWHDKQYQRLYFDIVI